MSERLAWIRRILIRMDIQWEDWVSVIGSLSIVATWFILLEVFDLAFIAVAFFWAGMSVLVFWYLHLYYKKKRDKRLIKMRFFISAIPNYIAFATYAYSVIMGIDLSQNYVLIPLWLYSIWFTVNAVILYVYAPKMKAHPVIANST